MDRNLFNQITKINSKKTIDKKIGTRPRPDPSILSIILFRAWVSHPVSFHCPFPAIRPSHVPACDSSFSLSLSVSFSCFCLFLFFFSFSVLQSSKSSCCCFACLFCCCCCFGILISQLIAFLKYFIHFCFSFCFLLEVLRTNLHPAAILFFFFFNSSSCQFALLIIFSSLSLSTFSAFFYDSLSLFVCIVSLA